VVRLDATIGEELAGWGKVLLLETRGRRTGRPATAAVGFVERADGVVIVAAGSQDANWSLNLEAQPTCRISRGGLSLACVARPVEDAERSMAIRDLILKYGTPAERLGAGPAWALTPIGDAATNRPPGR
jgi:deazaflavin-dependent oxidoreductase (nitroreductase family)